MSLGKENWDVIIVGTGPSWASIARKMARQRRSGQMNKFVIFAFNGNPMCFVHVLLNALDMDSKGMDAKIVIEGEAVKLVKEMEESGNPLYKKAKEIGLIDCICKACSAKMGVLDYNKTVGIPLGDDMNGHPSMAAYMDKGYQIITL